mmetsp:Transcript_28621/g.69776  ORF Transcript_28621/g.69776 Transcript_28621/m.69776 type:complete len:226 (+) Transcript_28621:829-1506(+)
MQSKLSVAPILKKGITLKLLATPPQSSMATEILTFFSSPRRPLNIPSALLEQKPCHTLSEVTLSIMVTARILDSLLMAAKGGVMLCSRTTRWISMALLLSQWDHTSSPAQPREQKARLSTHLVINATRMAKFASLFIIHLFRTRKHRLPSLSRKYLSASTSGRMRLRRSVKPTLRTGTTSKQLVMLLLSFTAMGIPMFSLSQRRLQSSPSAPLDVKACPISLEAA